VTEFILKFALLLLLGMIAMPFIPVIAIINFWRGDFVL
jgi:hypothetical protein